MATASSSTAIILKGAEDWERWLKQLKANISAEFWPYVDPATAADLEPLMAKPPRPVPRDFEQNA